MMRPAPWVLVLCVLVFCDGANAANWNITPRLRLGGSYSDNILLRENNKEGDFVARIVPGLSVRGRGGRLQMNLDYNLENLFYEADSSRDQTNHQFQGNATAELWRNRLFLDARGRVSQQLVDNQGRFTNSNLSITGNRADTVTYSFAPYFVHHFGSWADANIRYEYSDVTNKRNAGLDSEIDVITATLNSGRKFYRIPWGLTFRSREVSRSSGAEASFDSLRLNTSYRFSRKYQIDVTAGIEDNKFNTIENNVDGFYWTIGGTWTPSRRTQASFAMGERFFGTTMRASARHDRRRLSLSVDYNETPQTVNEQQALQRLIPLADENGEPIFDPDFVGDFNKKHQLRRPQPSSHDGSKQPKRMSFLSSFFLAALPLIAIPVALHFYKRKQKDVVPWGAMQFLTDAVIEGRRFERLEELLLMLLRVAAVVALVLAMAQPLVRGNWIGAAPDQDVILVLDDSMSMARKIDDVSSFDQLQNRVSDFMSQLSEKNSVQVMLASGGGRWLTSGPAAATGRTKRELVAAVEDLRPSNGSADMFACLQWVIDSEPGKNTQARRVVVFTDSQAYGWNTDAEGPWQQLEQSCQSTGVEGEESVPTSIQVVDCGADESQVNNLAIVRLEATRTLTGSDDPVTFTTEIKNVGSETSTAAQLKWIVGENQVTEVNVPQLKAGDSVQRTWSHAFKEQGVFSVGCKLVADDQLLPDNEQIVVVEVVDKIPFLIVEESSSDTNYAAARLLTATLGYENDTPRGEWQSVFAPRIIDFEQLKDETMADYRAVIIADMPKLSSDVIDRLRSFVERGGGLWVALGNRTDLETFNSLWFDEGAGLSPLKLSSPVGHGRAADAEFAIHPPSSDHTVTQQIADTKRLDIDEVRVSRHHQFVRDDEDSDVSILLETGVGAPLVIENYFGQGRVIIQAVPLSLQWSNMPLTKAYVVMAHDFLAYLTQPAATRFNLQRSGEIVYATPEALTSAKGQLETPLGDTVTLTSRDEGDATLCRFADTSLPGLYRLKFLHGDELLTTLPFYVSRDAEESDLKQLTDDQRNWLAENGGITFREKATLDTSSTTNLPSSRPVWWMLLTILLILIIVELALASQSARRRYAPAV